MTRAGRDSDGQPILIRLIRTRASPSIHHPALTKLASETGAANTGPAETGPRQSRREHRRCGKPASEERHGEDRVRAERAARRTWSSD